ncbi:hypothetical protein BD289DRAFT_137469 [Coniella lustricola]|uniref:Uncharacterized protein n=1 Tax=Coniella lustricola TaxID=2025994 RepID=A0A2T2ZVJ6_9PEZI|nr:hypothetical protein BD289DRAFT_137469 [Coniella lustricola]
MLREKTQGCGGQPVVAESWYGMSKTVVIGCLEQLLGLSRLETPCWGCCCLDSVVSVCLYGSLATLAPKCTSLDSYISRPRHRGVFNDHDDHDHDDDATPGQSRCHLDPNLGARPMIRSHRHGACLLICFGRIGGFQYAVGLTDRSSSAWPGPSVYVTGQLLTGSSVVLCSSWCVKVQKQALLTGC